MAAKMSLWDLSLDIKDDEDGTLLATKLQTSLGRLTRVIQVDRQSPSCKDEPQERPIINRKGLIEAILCSTESV